MADTTPATTTIPVHILDRKHAEWTLNHDAWDHIELLYQGGVRLRNNASAFLIQRPKELFDVYQERLRRFRYQDIIGNCVSWYLAKLFQREPHIEGNTPDVRFEELLQDCDRAGTTVQQFIRTLIETQLLFRRAFVLTDMPQPKPDAGPINTRADEHAAGVDQPYFVMWDPRQVFNWATDDDGNLKWLVAKTVTVQQTDPLGPVEHFAHWYIFDQTTYRHYQFKDPNDSTDPAIFFNNSSNGNPNSAETFATLMDSGPHSLASENRVPIQICELPTSLWFTSRAYLHLLAHVDALNGYDWKLFMTNHPQLVIQTETDIKGVMLSEVSYIKLEPNDKIFYLEPDPGSLSVTAEYLDTLRQEIYRDFNLQAQGRDSSATAGASSGYSKEMEMAPAIDMLNAIGSVLRAQVQLVLYDAKLAGRMAGDMPDVNGFKFEAKPILADIMKLQAAIDAGVVDKSATLERELDTTVALDMTDGDNEAVKIAIMAEVQAAPTRKEQRDLLAQQQMQSFETSLQKASNKGQVQAEQGSVAA